MSGSLFDSENDKRSNFRAWAIGLIALLVIASSAYGLYRFTKPTPPSADDLMAVDIRNNTVLMLDYQTFSGDEFRRQILGKGHLERYIKVNDEAFFTFPPADEKEFADCLLSSIDFASPLIKTALRTNASFICLPDAAISTSARICVNGASAISERINLDEGRPSCCSCSKSVSLKPTRSSLNNACVIRCAADKPISP